VYPRIDPTDEAFEVLPLVRGEWESFVRGRGSDLYRIREYMPEDSARHVDWKATAKSGSLKVREFAREDERRLCIVFDNPAAGAISDSAYEKSVDLTASLAWQFSTEAAEVSFQVLGSHRTRDLHEFLASLATIQPGNAEAPAQDMLVELNGDARDDYNIVITARHRGTMPTALWNRSYFVFAEDERGYNGGHS
jgi:uncharacterized protein (DUF58 family)